MKPENQRLSERVMLLEEEVRWFKEQYFGRSSQKSTSEITAEQKLLFNEAECSPPSRRPMPRRRPVPPRSQRVSARPILVDVR
jgi:hypothetical protein